MKHFTIFLLLGAICCCNCAITKKPTPAKTNPEKKDLDQRFTQLINKVNNTVVDIDKSEKVFTDKMSRLRNETGLARKDLEELIPRYTPAKVNSICGWADHEYITGTAVFLNNTKRCIEYRKMLVLGPLDLSKNILHTTLHDLDYRKNDYYTCENSGPDKKARPNCYDEAKRYINEVAGSTDNQISLVDKQFKMMDDMMVNQVKCPFYPEEEDLWMSNEQLEDRLREIKERALGCKKKIEQSDAQEEIRNNKRKTHV